MTVGFLPYGLPRGKFEKIADLELSTLDWPLSPSCDQGRISDLKEKDHIIMCVSSRALLVDHQGLRCKLSLVFFEPTTIHGRYYRVLPFLHQRFHRIFTYSSRVLLRIPNARFQTHGGTTLRLPIGCQEKTERISLIASRKKTTIGHRLRHRIAAWSQQQAPDVALLGRGFRELKTKVEGHLPFMYSIVIENCREPGYFTEKLIDSFLCLSLPIYWGAPDLSQFFDPRGVIVCHSEVEMRQAILRVDEKEYQARLPYLIANRERAEGYLDPGKSMAQMLVDEDRLILGKAG